MNYYGQINSKVSSEPPLASPETIFSLTSTLRDETMPSLATTNQTTKIIEEDRNGNHQETEFPLDPTHHLQNLMPFEQFKRLDLDSRHNEIMKLVSCLNPMASQLNSMRRNLDTAFNNLEEIESRGKDIQDSNHNKYFCVDSPLSSISYSGLQCMIGETQAPDPFLIAKSKKMNKRLALNVGGIRHEVMWKMLQQVPHSRLGMLYQARTHEDILELCADYSLVDNEFFFDRHPRSFNTILNFYRTGKLHIADEMCILAFRDDLDFWRIPEQYMETCCLDKFLAKKELIIEEMEICSTKLKKDEEEDFGTHKFAKYQKMIWDLIEHPDTSVAAQVVSVLSMVFVGISIIGMTINTLHSLQYIDADGNTIDNPTLALVETICIAWFTLEYFIRLAGAPKKWNFLKDEMNIVDVLAIMPYFLSLFFLNPESSIATTPSTRSPLDTGKVVKEEEGGSVEDILQVFRIFKLARVLKLARHSPGLQAIAYTLKNSYKELGLLIFLICISGLIFSSLAYFIEKDEDSGFTSIPTAFYWVVVTMTTVGYGDIFPVTGLGKLVGTFCAISGVLVLSLPIPIIAGNFEKFHKDQGLKVKAEIRKKKLHAAKIAEEEDRLAYVERTRQALLEGRSLHESRIESRRESRRDSRNQTVPGSPASLSNQDWGTHNNGTKTEKKKQ